MSKKFAEYSKFDLSDINKEVLTSVIRLFRGTALG